jgi:alpha-ketoglutarate-dependent taurine dioxygenase
VRFSPLFQDGALPVVAEPEVAGIELAGWIAEHREVVEERLHRHGAVLFRGFGVTEPARFDRVISALAGDALAYTERSSPRSQVQGNIYTSTDHPADQAIFLHNEQSYNQVFPLRIFFCASVVATAGGQTPLADSRRVFARLPVGLRAKLLDRGYQIVRNYSPHLGVSWREAFQTDDRARVAAYCREHGLELQWRGEDRLRTRQRRRVAGLHPVTGEATWFNHATFFHVSTLSPNVAAALLSGLGEDELPTNTFYGDAEPFSAADLEALRAAYHAETVQFPWQAGDVLAIDNMLVAHGRAPFTGPRRVLAGMARPVAWSDIKSITP